MTNAGEIRRLREARGASSSAIVRFLLSKGIARPYAEEIAAESVDLYPNHSSCLGIDSLGPSITKRIRSSSSMTFPAKIALVGPTGVGKSTTITKLRAYFNAKDQDVTFIDTCGCNFYEPNRVDQIGEELSAHDNLTILLTLSATAKDVDIYGAIHQFSPLRPSGLLFTKLDETLSSGVILNVCLKTDLPIYFIAYGYPLPGYIEAADPEKITRKILTDHNTEEYQFLRQLIME